MALNLASRWELWYCGHSARIHNLLNSAGCCAFFKFFYFFKQYIALKYTLACCVLWILCKWLSWTTMAKTTRVTLWSQSSPTLIYGFVSIRDKNICLESYMKLLNKPHLLKGLLFFDNFQFSRVLELQGLSFFGHLTQTYFED